ncbi:hypothetical protein EJ08DRAFT_739509 [Tothia fuscella]|uniref:Uncharacterized protein n=1 Tax=Tothia fuscella TaxID=1048955 RepID=A0A9P4NE65_9PEZI|nr:hypothetical protein EJ08DRAFT_739509 [Tothia fuscella]
MAETQPTKPIPIPKAAESAYVRKDPRICLCQTPNVIWTTIAPELVYDSSDSEAQSSITHASSPCSQDSSLGERGFFPDDDDLKKSTQNSSASQAISPEERGSEKDTKKSAYELYTTQHKSKSNKKSTSHKSSTKVQKPIKKIVGGFKSALKEEGGLKATGVHGVP